MFDKMPHRNLSEHGGSESALRRSPRFLRVNSSATQKSKSKAKQGSRLPSSCSDNGSLRPPLRSIENASSENRSDGSLDRFSKNLVGSVSGSEISGKSSTGSRKSERKVKGFEGFHGLRRSPRFSDKENVSESVCEKANGSKPDEGNWQSAQLECRIDLDAKSLPKLSRHSGERALAGAAGTASSAEIVGRHEVVIALLANEVRGTMGGGRADFSAVSPAKKMELSRGSRRKNVDKRVEEDAYNGEMPQCMKNVGAPCGKNLVGGTKKSMECTSGSGKSTGKVKQIKGIQGSRRSSRFSNVSSVLGVNAKRSKGEDKTNEAKEENDAKVSNHASGGLSKKGVQLEVLQNSSRHRSMEIKKVEGKAGAGFNSWKEGTKPSSDIVAETPRNGCREKSVGNINAKSGVSTLEQVGNQFDENVGCEGWTEEQEAALQRAYFAARPSPHFWKKVAKLVPGKSAQECFDRVHSSFPTPPQRPPHSRAKKTDSSPSLSGSKLLEPIDLRAKRLKRKEKRCLVQKTARHLLQKHSIRDQGYEADLFSIFESTTNSSTQTLVQTKMLSTPDCSYKGHGFLQQCQERSSSCNRRKPLSRLNNSSETPLASPPVLKPVKNMKLHEKYIDQLHRREATRRVEGRKCSTTNKDTKLNPIQKTGIVQAAKENLVSDAKDMIYKFQDLQANAMKCCEDSDEEYSGDLRDDEGEES